MRWLRFRRTTVLAAGALLAAALAGAAPLFADEPTIAVNGWRTAWDANEPGLSPAHVAALKRLSDTPVNGQVFAQPLVVGSRVIVATERNYVYGLDSKTGKQNWSASLGPAWPAAAVGCGDLAPYIGVTSTPVYDSSSGYVYLVSHENNGKDATHPNWYVHALNAVTGHERSGWPVRVAGAPTNDPTRPFNGYTAMQRPGLLLMGGSVYAGFASNCDIGPYVGYLLGVNTTSRKQTLWSTEAGTANGQAGIWMSGGGLVSDRPGRIILSTGNGDSPPVGPGNLPPSHLGDSVVQLRVMPDGTMVPQQFFSPSNADTLNAHDTDLGSGAPTVLPPLYFGTRLHPHLMVQPGKDGRVFLLDRDNLGGRSAGADQVLGTVALWGGVWGHMATWGGDGGYVYVVEATKPNRLLALKYGATPAGLPTLSKAGASVATFGYSSGSPVVTSTGTNPGSAVVWVEQSAGSYGTGHLYAYRAVPVGGVLKPLLSVPLPLGAMTKFQVPATDGNHVYVGTNGHLFIFG